MNIEVNESFSEIHLEEGEAITTEGRSAAWIYGEVDIKTNVKGSIDLAVNAAAETLFLSTYTCRGGGATIGFGLRGSGSVIEHPLAVGEIMIAMKDVLLAVEPSVKVEIYAHKKVDLHGIYRRVTGPGIAFWEIPGAGREFLLTEDEEILVDSAYLAMYQPTIRMRAARMRAPKQNASVGSERSMTKLGGPGKVWLQNA